MQKLAFYFNLTRLAFFQTSFGIIYAILTDTLNRVMTIELGIAAALVGALIGIREVMVLLGVKIWAGNLSDKTHFFGYKRTPFILGGLLLCSAMFALIAPLAIELNTNFWLYLPLLIAVFTIFGIGYHASLTTYYALIADYVGEKSLSKVAATSWILMVLTGIFTSVVMSKALKDFTNEKLIAAMQNASLLALAIGVVTIVGVERRETDAAQQDGEALSFFQSLRLIADSPMTKAFFVYVFISIFAAFGNELIMEPFGADVHGLSVSETTKFRQYLGGAQLIFMLLTGFSINRIGLKNAIVFGNTVATVGFSILFASAVTLNLKLLYIGLVTIGIGLGSCTVGNIVFMISMHAGRSGLYLGLWGTAQSLANFTGELGMGAVRDALMHLFPNPTIAYSAVFGLEILAFTIASLMLPQFSQEKFEAESKVSLARVLAVASD
ncbi:MAG: BCD family MFS transporter [Chloroherpetonaceae bacterium]|nr:BCD family MFS transporter [Chloroherpetonaceae bacterium]MCS7211815.1 BCD family MFS transporter [Chloroherpetonaceae bacterium]MDW8018596.1 BCD family MFS transporter [Chloroherpetonaceae bacterium]MDW8467300.1 BCD family MFS transporter [Chloroherpetonaceae bacterium]